MRATTQCWWRPPRANTTSSFSAPKTARFTIGFTSATPTSNWSKKPAFRSCWWSRGSPRRRRTSRLCGNATIHSMERREVETPPEPPWVALSDEELLKLRVCDLHVRVEGSELEPRVAQLYEELAARGISLRPEIYLGDEWFSPEGLAAVAIPFYLAHPRLKSLELHQMMEVEGGTPEWCMKLLRHECGHALDHSYRFSERRKWRQIFGSPEAEYAPEHYRPRPYSRSFVRHLDNWYAQAHPDEDFAETFAVWLATPAAEWRVRYRRWKALEKLEYIEELMQEAKKPPMPQPARRRRISEASKLRKTLERHYAARRKLYAEDFPDFYDSDLRIIFASGAPDGEPA